MKTIWDMEIWWIGVHSLGDVRRMRSGRGFDRASSSGGPVRSNSEPSPAG